MVELGRWRLRLDDDGNYILSGVNKHGIIVSKSITKQNIQRIDLDTSFLQIHLSNRIYRLWFKNADLSKPVVPMRIMKKQPRQSYLDAVYCLIAEVSYYLSGFEKEVNRDYLRNTKSLQVYFGDVADEDGSFQLETAIDILLRAGGVR